MQAIILCGGLGTRLRSVIGEKQKTMTETGGEPFLVKVVNYLKSYDVRKITFATGYKSEEVRSYFGEKYFFGVEVSYAVEKEPLGTGGAIRNCLDLIRGDKVIVLNGDTLFEANLNKLIENQKNLDSDMSIACKEVDDKKRYGTVVVDKKTGLVQSFNEKIEVDTNVTADKETEEKNSITSYINGGIYIFKKELIATISPNVKISLEQDLMPKWLDEGKKIGAVLSSEEFVDIGTPESLEKFKDSLEK